MNVKKCVVVAIIIGFINPYNRIEAQASNQKNNIKLLAVAKPTSNTVHNKKTIVTKKKATSTLKKPVSTKSLSTALLSKLKAVIVIGSSELTTKGNIAEQTETAKYLRSIGVNVVELYYPNNKWEDIKKESEGANIFIYAGHGSNMGGQDKLGNDKVGGLVLSKKEMITSEQISNELHLHKNALVIFNHVCGTAGSSAIDISDIGVKLATQRVLDYSCPFIKLDIGGYYANNICQSVIPFLTCFFENQPIGIVYKKCIGLWDKIEIYKPIENKPYVIGVSSCKQIDYKSYDIAYVGKPNFTVYDFFK